MSLLNGTGIEEFPKAFHEDIAWLKNQLCLAFDMRRKKMGYEDALYLRKKDDDTYDNDLDPETIEEFMNLDHSADLLKHYGPHLYDQYIEKMTYEAQQILYTGEFKYKLDDLLVYDGLFFKEDLVEAYIALTNLKSFQKDVGSMLEFKLRNAFSILNVFLFLRKEDPANARIYTLLEASELLEVPYVAEAYKYYLSEKKIKSYIGNSLSKAMRVSVIEDNPFVDSIIEDQLSIDIVNDFFLLTYDEDELQGLPFTAYFHKDAFPPDYQYQMNKYQVFDAGVERKWGEIETIVVEHGSMTNVQLLLVSRLSRAWYSAVIDKFRVKAHNKTWIPEVVADKGYAEYNSKCIFHYDVEDCNMYEKLPSEREEDMVSQLIDTVKHNCPEGFLGKLCAIDLKLFFNIIVIPWLQWI